MTTRMRKLIEWHFYNYDADKKMGAEQVRDIAEAGMSVVLDRIGSISGRIANPTENKAIRLEECAKQYLWAKVVENTYTAFRFEPEYEVMCSLYVERKRWKDMLADGLNESTFWYWRNRWLAVALMWATEYGLAI